MLRVFRRRSRDFFCLLKQHSDCLDTGAHRVFIPPSRTTSQPRLSFPSTAGTSQYARTCSSTIWGATDSVSEALKKEQDRRSQHKIHAASDILQQVAERKLVQHLKQESQMRLLMPIEEAMSKAKEFGAAYDDEEAKALITALHTSGDVLRHDNKLYLKPEEVAEMVLRALPDTEEEAQAKLREIDQELEPMKREFRSIEYKAQTRSAMIAYAGIGLLCCQFALFLRLTYWELSWDVMEPISYFSGQVIGILMYAYFLAYKQDFSYEQAANRYTDTEKFKLIEQSNFNFEKYHRLMGDANRWKRLSRALGRR